MNQFVVDYLTNKGYEVNKTAVEILKQADDWYRVRETEDHKRVTINGMGYTLARMGFAKRAAADDANLCEVVEINAGDKNGDFITDFLDDNRFDVQYREQLELTSAEGTAACYVRLDGGTVMTDGSIRGGRIRLNYIDANGYLPLTVENGEVLEAAFCGDTHAGTETRTMLVIFTRRPDGIYECETVTFDKDGTPDTQPVVRLGDVKPFAIMRTAEVNNIDGMPGYGYPKVYGAIPIFLGLDAAFSAFLGDIDKSEALIFINEKLCGFDEAGTPIPPNEQMKRRFVFLGDKLPDVKTLVQFEQPLIRIDQFEPTVQFLLDLLSLKFGYGTKKYSFKGGQVATATQYIGERQDMMQELNKQRYQSAQYIKGIIRAVLWFSNTFNGTSYDLDEEISIAFDDSYIENNADRLESYRQDALSGLGGAYVRQLYLQEKYNLTDEEAALWAGAEDDMELEEGA